MKTCPICNKRIKTRCLIDGKIVNTQRRKFCYDCSPFGSGNNKQLKCDEIAAESKQRKRNKNKNQYRKYQKRFRIERKKKLVEMFGGKCIRCGYSKCIKALDFHHINRKGKKYNLSSLGYTCSWKRLIEEAQKCELLCANCHREKEDGLD